jgi:hypothetical protein
MPVLRQYRTDMSSDEAITTSYKYHFVSTLAGNDLATFGFVSTMRLSLLVDCVDSSIWAYGDTVLRSGFGAH